MRITNFNKVAPFTSRAGDDIEYPHDQGMNATDDTYLQQSRFGQCQLSAYRKDQQKR